MWFFALCLCLVSDLIANCTAFSSIFFLRNSKVPILMFLVGHTAPYHDFDASVPPLSPKLWTFECFSFQCCSRLLQPSVYRLSECLGQQYHFFDNFIVISTGIVFETFEAFSNSYVGMTASKVFLLKFVALLLTLPFCVSCLNIFYWFSLHL